MGWPGPLTHRQFLTWTEWVETEWNNPDRTDHYLMQAAHEARYAMAEKKPSFNPKHYRLEFRRVESAGGSPRPLTVEEVAAVSKAKWGAIVGGQDSTKGKAK